MTCGCATMLITPVTPISTSQAIMTGAYSIPMRCDPAACARHGSPQLGGRTGRVAASLALGAGARACLQSVDQQDDSPGQHVGVRKVSRALRAIEACFCQTDSLHCRRDAHRRG